MLVGAGVGLGPHVVKRGLTVTSAASVALVLGGVALVIRGGRDARRSQRPIARIGSSLATIVVVAVVVWLVAPGVAATSVPSTAITTTPADVGLDAESVTLTTTDGVDLAAWYLPGNNSAGVVVMHGAGSTRSDVLDQAAVLAEHGYAVVSIDARGHGDSGGTAMDFGWYGDLDIAAGTAFLASRPDIDATRIGIVGFSMGGEEAIGASATDPLIRAVVAEGATGRQPGDKAWLSDAYGWRGTLQEGVERVQYGITDLLTDASPPLTLRSAVTDAPSTRFLLIAAGNVTDETHAARFIQDAAPERVSVWTVDGAAHTGGYATRPDEWQRHVLEFLDENLM